MVCPGWLAQNVVGPEGESLAPASIAPLSPLPLVASAAASSPDAALERDPKSMQLAPPHTKLVATRAGPMLERRMDRPMSIDNLPQALGVVVRRANGEKPPNSGKKGTRASASFGGQ